MHPFMLYLIAINVVTFLVFAIDFLLCTRRPGRDGSAARSLVLDAFPVAGGAVGMLAALFVFSGLVHRHRMNKDNVAWWFLAIACLVAWGLVAAVALGFVSLDASVASVFSGWDMGRLAILGAYLAVINATAFVLFAWDKHVSENGNDYRRRLPEARLLGLCLIGGSIGGLIAMRALRHKTRRWYFVWGLPLFALLDMSVVVYAHMAGLI